MKCLYFFKFSFVLFFLIHLAETVEDETRIVYSALLGSVAKTEVCAEIQQMGALDIARYA